MSEINPTSNFSRNIAHPKVEKMILPIIQEQDLNKDINKVFGKAYTILKPLDPNSYHLGALSCIEEMLDILEEKKYISKKYIYQEYRKNENIPKHFTTKEILLELLDQTLMNSIEAMCKKWSFNNYVNSNVSIIAFTEEDKLCVRIIDNGDGFPEHVLSKIGNESLSSRAKRSSNEFYFQDALNDHLFKTGQLTQVLGWKLIVENNKFTGGGSVSIVLPLPDK